MKSLFKKLRLYYKSRNNFLEGLKNSKDYYFLPFKFKDVKINLKSGRDIILPKKCWDLLPIICRLDKIGAVTKIENNRKKIVINGVTLYSPLWTRSESQFYKEIFIDDIYQINKTELAGKTVIDIGAFVGDTAVAFARAGATVYCFEPSSELCEYISINAEANGVRDKIFTHDVGLSDRSYEVSVKYGVEKFVEAISYTVNNIPKNVDMVKMDCEGGEYYLLNNPSFLQHLSPKFIQLEYHQGSASIIKNLLNAGYKITMHSNTEPIGLIEARK